MIARLVLGIFLIIVVGSSSALAAPQPSPLKPNKTYRWGAGGIGSSCVPGPCLPQLKISTNSAAQIKSWDFKAAMKKGSRGCKDGRWVGWNSNSERPMIVSAAGKIAYSLRTRRYSFRVRATVGADGRVIKGGFVLKGKFDDGRKCSSGKVKFTAR